MYFYKEEYSDQQLVKNLLYILVQQNLLAYMYDDCILKYMMQAVN